eukprot:Rhum_TRINITY_DN2917_c0_g1::Rhum_TRINITY_DN2917_c0_g1_i1::g.8934::m.8934
MFSEPTRFDRFHRLGGSSLNLARDRRDSFGSDRGTSAHSKRAHTPRANSRSGSPSALGGAPTAADVPVGIGSLVRSCSAKGFKDNGSTGKPARGSPQRQWEGPSPTHSGSTTAGTQLSHPFKHHNDARVRAVVRIRPFLKREKADAARRKQLLLPTLRVEDDHVIASNGHAFGFDAAFTDTEQQGPIFEEVGRPAVEHALQGFNSSIFAYGQTNSGKTYTMLGKDLTATGLAGPVHPTHDLNRNPGSFRRTVSRPRRGSLTSNQSFGRRGSFSSARSVDDDDTEESSYEAGRGLTQRIVGELFAQIEKKQANLPHHVHVEVSCSFMEVYLENVRDLLHPSSDDTSVGDLKVRVHPVSGPFVEGLTSVNVRNAEHMLKLLKKGGRERVSACTAHNERSSRSHAIFQITVKQTEKLEAEGRGGKTVSTVSTFASRISLVDLAGSERIAAPTTHAPAVFMPAPPSPSSTITPDDESVFPADGNAHVVEQAASNSVVSPGTPPHNPVSEVASINLSLGTLRRVIDTLIENAHSKKKAKRLPPYRESKLTWLLSESLGGNSRTVMIGTVSPHADCFDESLSTLRYTLKARGIVNRVYRSEDRKVTMIRNLKAEISDLKSRLSGSSGLSLLPHADSNLIPSADGVQQQQQQQQLSITRSAECGVQSCADADPAFLDEHHVEVEMQFNERLEACVEEKDAVIGLVGGFLGIPASHGRYHSDVVFERDLVEPAAKTDVLLSVRRSAVENNAAVAATLEAMRSPSEASRMEGELRDLLQERNLDATRVSVWERGREAAAAGLEGSMSGSALQRSGSRLGALMRQGSAVVLDTSSTQRQYAALQKRHHTVMKEKEALTEEVARVRRVEETLHTTVAELTKEVSGLCGTLLERNDMCMEAQNKIDARDIDIRLLRREVAMLQADKAELSDTVSLLRQQLASNGADTEQQVAERLHSMTEMLAQKNKSVDSLTAANEALKYELSVSQSKLQRHKERLLQAQANLQKDRESELVTVDPEAWRPGRQQAGVSQLGKLASHDCASSDDGETGGLEAELIVDRLPSVAKLQRKYETVRDELTGEARRGRELRASCDRVTRDYQALVKTLENRGFSVDREQAPQRQEGRRRLVLARQPRAAPGSRLHDAPAPTIVNNGARERGRPSCSACCEPKEPRQQRSASPFAQPIGSIWDGRRFMRSSSAQHERWYPKPWMHANAVNMLPSPKMFAPGDKYASSAALRPYPSSRPRSATPPPMFK